MALGITFAPTGEGLDENARKSRMLPFQAQQAIQALKLQIPRVLGARSIAGRRLLESPGSMGVATQEGQSAENAVQALLGGSRTNTQPTSTAIGARVLPPGSPYGGPEASGAGGAPNAPAPPPYAPSPYIPAPHIGAGGGGEQDSASEPPREPRPMPRPSPRIPGEGEGPREMPRAPRPAPDIWEHPNGPEPGDTQGGASFSGPPSPGAPGAMPSIEDILGALTRGRRF